MCQRDFCECLDIQAEKDERAQWAREAELDEWDEYCSWASPGESIEDWRARRVLEDKERYRQD